MCNQILAHIYRGEDKTFTVHLGPCHNLTGATEIHAIFQKTDGTALDKKLTTGDIAVIDALEGKFDVSLSAADTLLMMTGNVVQFEIKYVISGKIEIEQRNIEVLAPLF